MLIGGVAIEQLTDRTESNYLRLVAGNGVLMSLCLSSKAWVARLISRSSLLPWPRLQTADMTSLSQEADDAMPWLWQCNVGTTHNAV